jgi:hypothetical protein
VETQAEDLGDPAALDAEDELAGSDDGEYNLPPTCTHDDTNPSWVPMSIRTELTERIVKELDSRGFGIGHTTTQGFTLHGLDAESCRTQQFKNSLCFFSNSKQTAQTATTNATTYASMQH